MSKHIMWIDQFSNTVFEGFAYDDHINACERHEMKWDNPEHSFDHNLFSFAESMAEFYGATFMLTLPNLPINVH